MVGSIKISKQMSDMESFYDEKVIILYDSCLFALPTFTYAASPYFSFKDGDGFKRFSVSAGPLYVKPTGKAQPLHVNTAIAEGTKQE